MRLLRIALTVILVGLVVGPLLTASVGLAHPPPEPDHGVNASTFYTWWAGDADDGPSTRPSTSGVAVRDLARSTDVPLASPPRAVERWNRGDLEAFPATSRERSIHPPDASLVDGRFIRDAYAAVAAVQPSTRVHVAPSTQPLYVAPAGEVLGTVDYRVAVPANDTAGDRRVYWRVHSHAITRTRLLVNGTPETTARGAHTTALPYSLAEHAGAVHELTLQATIAVAIRKRIETCTAHIANNSSRPCTAWNTTIEQPTETVTVRDAVRGVEHALDVTGTVARYPNGDVGLRLSTRGPWRGFTAGDGGVRAGWRFYVARDAAWDRLIVRTAADHRVRHSPLHPVQVHAYPSATGPTSSPRGALTILDVAGPERSPPTLPGPVALDVVVDPYTSSPVLVVRLRRSHLASLTAYGLVRGVSVGDVEPSLDRVSLTRSALALTVRNRTAETVTVGVHLRDATTGAPISTAHRDGAIVVAGKRVNTNATGRATVTLPRSTGRITARYEPRPWWRGGPGYVGDTATVAVRGPSVPLLALAWQLLVPTAVFLLGVFLVDRITGWRVWPPWRRLS